jgi:phenylalanyl-tRNA synthetase beta subunit
LCEWGKIVQGKAELGRFGQVFPPLVRKMDMRDPVFMAEWNLSWFRPAAIRPAASSR